MAAVSGSANETVAALATFSWFFLLGPVLALVFGIHWPLFRVGGYEPGDPSFLVLPVATLFLVAGLGDLGAGWDYSILNRAFRQAMDGAELIALPEKWSLLAAGEDLGYGFQWDVISSVSGTRFGDFALARAGLATALCAVVLIARHGVGTTGREGTAGSDGTGGCLFHLICSR